MCCSLCVYIADDVCSNLIRRESVSCVHTQHSTMFVSLSIGLLVGYPCYARDEPRLFTG